MHKVAGSDRITDSPPLRWEKVKGTKRKPKKLIASQKWTALL